MTKKQQEVSKRDEKSNQVTTYDYGEMAGAGTENVTANDIAIPFLNVLQSNSPQLAKGDPQYIAGVEAGDILNLVTGEVIDGEEGFFFVPVYRDHCVVEWVPRQKGGGFVARHDLEAEPVLKSEPNPEKPALRVAPNGNDLQETYYLYGMIISSPEAEEPEDYGIIAFKSTMIKTIKRLNYRLQKVELGFNPPLFAHRLKFAIRQESNRHGRWYTWDAGFAVDDDIKRSLIPPMLDGKPHPLLQMGNKLYKQIKKGEVEVAYDTENATSGAGSAPSDDVF